MLAILNSQILLAIEPTGFDPLSAIIRVLGLIILTNVLIYLYFGITLMVIARKTNTPNSWMAWIPIANLFLMCKIGRRSYGCVPLLLIPIVNLVVVAILWMSIAEAREQPSWIGALILIPGIGLLIPLYLAFSKDNAVVNNIVAPRFCPNCRKQAEGFDMFCNVCGVQVPPPMVMAAPAKAPAPIGKLILTSILTVVFSLGLYGVGGWLAFGREIAYTPPVRTKPLLPKHVEGTMTEFPVDSNVSTNSPNHAQPASVITQNWSQGSSSTVSVPPNWLPPGVRTETISHRTNTMVSANYRSNNAVSKRPTRTTSSPNSNTQVSSIDDQVYVHVLDVAPNQARIGDELANSIAITSGGERTGVKIENPNGNTYIGSRIRTEQNTTYVLNKQNADIVIVIYAPSPEEFETADRLARNVGNGQGLNDYPEVQSSIWTLPPSPPNLQLQEVYTLTGEDILRSIAELERSASKEQMPEVDNFIQQVKQFIPERITQARYLDDHRQEWGVIVGDYASTRRAWTTWSVVSWSGIIQNAQTINVSGVNGILVNEGQQQIIFFQKGPYLVIVAAPRASSMDKLIALTNGFQI